MDKEDNIDYYEILQCDRNATIEELKKNYQQLALTLHPDKNLGDKNAETFLLVQKAWSVLRDPQSRRQYDATLNLQENIEPLLYETVLLSDMCFDEDNNVYTYDCRCGGIYLLDAEEFFTSNIVIGCDECSFSIQINR
ncbi:DPH4 homolog [Manduca sexta]|uniref:Uncharacterized protein n=1 Tax=Manduca sexta TaxID=7130 RepID=A0A921YPA9_MANSE|nr:DPH4 homolog [Manduca sexta]KAG6442739.1 hypothetical protein O3G_MSEX002448 [Manduca sexta]